MQNSDIKLLITFKNKTKQNKPKLIPDLVSMGPRGDGGGVILEQGDVVRLLYQGSKNLPLL